MRLSLTKMIVVGLLAWTSGLRAVPHAFPDNPFIGTWVATIGECQETYRFTENGYFYSLSGEEKNRRQYQMLSRFGNLYEIKLYNRINNEQPDCHGEVTRNGEFFTMLLYFELSTNQDYFEVYPEPGGPSILGQVKKQAKGLDVKGWEFAVPNPVF